ncbi:MAG: MliC family protein [Spirochaetaceae bacterium]|nr:MliC family protein [Spirochaetaceae bacterium]
MLKNIIIKVPFLGLLSVILLLSCQSVETAKPEENSGKLEQRRIVSETQNNIVYTRIINAQGELLELIFDNAKNEAILMLDGEKINLKSQVTASGTKYSNEQYLFTQWKDEIELKKDGKTIYKY